ncbi:MAG: hypothetical protein F6K36_24285 [Symploca sp. SIO3C6]|nr:hypothetical protein [Symploca sp. SIO3C6]NEO99093.1 hypothetical protein [Symploca sp. SIO2E9]NET07813.1 hypothetical protein [Symploca sp. SIO2B6]NET48482.1 hypothetical protein [Merismopedia sp. SIO2A8]
MIKKKDLQERYGITLNTVRQTLEACGLDTSRQEYTEAEITERFEVARRMITEEKKSYAEVASHFGANLENQEDEQQEAFEQDEQEQGFQAENFISDALSQSIQENTAEYVQEIVEDALADVVPHIPQMLYYAGQRLVRSGGINDVFLKMREQRRQLRNVTDSFGMETYGQGGLPGADYDDSEEED